MSGKGRYLSTVPSLNEENYQSENMASFVTLANCRPRKRILVVDDEFDTNLTIKVVLETDNFKVDSFTDPHAALRNFTTGLYDLALIDLRMPVMNGFALYSEIKKLDNDVKICFLTAAEDTYYEAFRNQAFPEHDENRIIRKPVENESLIEHINSIIG